MPLTLRYGGSISYILLLNSVCSFLIVIFSFSGLGTWDSFATLARKGWAYRDIKGRGQVECCACWRRCVNHAIINCDSSFVHNVLTLLIIDTCTPSLLFKQYLFFCVLFWNFTLFPALLIFSRVYAACRTDLFATSYSTTVSNGYLYRREIEIVEQR